MKMLIFKHCLSLILNYRFKVTFFACIILVTSLYAEKENPLGRHRVILSSGISYLKIHDDLYSPVTYSGYLIPLSLAYEYRNANIELGINIQFISPYSLYSRTEIS